MLFANEMGSKRADLLSEKVHEEGLPERELRRLLSEARP
jgi:hypothetical protein